MLDNTIGAAMNMLAANARETATAIASGISNQFERLRLCEELYHFHNASMSCSIGEEPVLEIQIGLTDFMQLMNDAGISCCKEPIHEVVLSDDDIARAYDDLINGTLQ